MYVVAAEKKHVGDFYLKFEIAPDETTSVVGYNLSRLGSGNVGRARRPIVGSSRVQTRSRTSPHRRVTAPTRIARVIVKRVVITELLSTRGMQRSRLPQEEPVHYASERFQLGQISTRVRYLRTSPLQ